MLALGLASARPSAAEPTVAERARLETLLREGDAAAKAKKWQACIEARSAALRIEDAANIAGDLGLCEEQAGRISDAMNHVLRALAEATPAMKAQEPWKSYQAAAHRMAPRVEMVVLTLKPTSALVIMDGRPLGKADGHRLAMSYGEHTFVVRAEGYEDANVTHNVTRGIRNIDVVLDKKPPPPAAPAAPAEPAPVPAPPPARATPTPRPETRAAQPPAIPCLPARSVRGVLVPLACVTGAAFLASAATTIGFEVHAATMRNALIGQGFAAGACTPGQPKAGSAECAEIRSRVQQRTDAANAMIGTGIAAAVLAAGAGLAIALEPKGPSVAATASLHGGGVIVQGSW